jgi:hypothetical protein
VKEKRKWRELKKCLGPVICPKCGGRGILRGVYRKRLDAGTILGPYFYVVHAKYSDPESLSGDVHRIPLTDRGKTRTCYIKKPSMAELDELVKRRPWPITAEDAVKSLKQLLDGW